MARFIFEMPDDLVARVEDYRKEHGLKATAEAVRRLLRRGLGDDDDAPELDAAFFEKARPAREVIPEAAQADFKRSPGRPKSSAPKKPVSLRLSPDVVEKFKASGPGWQTRMDEALKEAEATKPKLDVPVLTRKAFNPQPKKGR